jgi:exodeoxyribonuclease VII small subunit
MADKKPAGNNVEIPAEIAGMSFEQALAALESIVQRLEAGNVDLEESIDIYTRGNQLRAHCEAKLATAQTRIEKITQNQAGQLSVSPLEVD